MADKITTSEELQINWAFQDGDTRLVKLPNPKPNLTDSAIKAVADKFIQNQIIIGDKTGASLTGVVSAKIIEKTKTTVDLEYEP